MTNRRKFLQASLLALPLTALGQTRNERISASKYSKPLVVSTWDSGIRANSAAWDLLKNDGKAIDAVEAAARSAEDETTCCVGLDAYPDRDGKVTLDASIMDHLSNCGSVAFLQHCKHPISVARKIMESTPHVFLVGEGAEQFAIENGFPRFKGELSPSAATAYEEWLKKSKYEPVINIENIHPTPQLSQTSPNRFDDGSFNHDTMGTIALDSGGNLSGACTTSGMAFKMHGRIGDSPIIGSGLFVDNEVGAATSSGVGEEVIRICGTHLIIELMRFGYSPEKACREAINRIVKRDPDKAKDFQVGFVAIAKDGEIGAFSVQKEFTYAVTNRETNEVLSSKSYF